jgi:hypothetical protein
MKELSEYKKYQVITVPDLKGVNCLYVNGSLLHCAIEEMPNSAKVIFNFFLFLFKNTANEKKECFILLLFFF